MTASTARAPSLGAFTRWALRFRTTISFCAEVLRSATRRGIPSEDINHAIDTSVAAEAGDDPVGWLVPGSDRAGNPAVGLD